MYDSFSEQILQSLNNLLPDLNNFILIDFSPTIQRRHVFIDKIQETAFRTELSDNIAVSFAFVDVVTFNNIGMIHQFQYLYLVLEELHTGG